MVLRGYADLTENELASQKDLSEMNQIAMEMTQTFAILILKMQMVKQIVVTSNKQWIIFLKNYRKWFGLDIEDSPIRLSKFKKFAL